MIKIRIKNADHEIDVRFPISENELYAKLAEIHAIEEKDAPQSAFVTEVYWPEEFSMLKDRFANLDELNYLAKRMESFDYHEYDQFLIGITKLQNPTEKDLINLTFNLDHFTLCKDVSSYGKIGREYVMNTQGAVPANDEDDPKYAAIGKELIDKGLAQITGKGLLIYNPFDELTEVYDGQTFPEYYYGRYVSMKINAVIENKDGGTLVLDFPRSIYDVYEKIQSVGIRKSPHQITLSDEEGNDVRVKLYSEDEVGKHLLLTLNEQNTLADANLLAFMVDNAKEDFRSKLEQKLLHNQYGSMQEVTDDIKKMLYESGPVKAVFYCPLVGEVTDDEGFSSPVDGRFLKSYAWAIEEALEADTADDEMDMAEFFDEDDGVKAKLVSAKWGVETYRGRLFGRIECSLKEELTDTETEILTDWISGQNSDGYGEHFEQQPIDTEDDDLYVSFWNSGDNYSIMTHDELDAYIDNQGMTMGGM